MSGAAFEKIAAGLADAIEMAREGKPAAERASQPLASIDRVPAPRPGDNSGGEGGQLRHDAHANRAYTPPETLAAGERGQSRRDAHGTDAPSPAATHSDDGTGQIVGDAQLYAALPSSETINQIRALHRERERWMDLRKRADLSLGAWLRTELGWRLGRPAAELAAIQAQAKRIAEAGEKHLKAVKKALAAARKGMLQELPDMPDELKPWAHIVLPNIEARGHFDVPEAKATKNMEAAAATLPVAEWANSIRGFGMLGLAIVVGEAGDLANYANPGKLWKRMGVAVIDGKRQGGLPKTAPKADWIAHGYNRQRRSRLYRIGSALVMQSGETPYRRIYLDRKAFEAAKAEAEGLTVAPAGKIPAKNRDAYRSLGHIDARARRYVEKRLLRDLWNAWRGGHSAGADQTTVSLPPLYAPGE